MKNQSPSRWILIGLMALMAVSLIVVYAQLGKLNAAPKNSNSMIVTVEAVAEESVSAPTQEPRKPTASLDQKWFRVQGPVKTIKETTVSKFQDGSKYTNVETYHFDKNGKYSPGNPQNFTFKRNKHGQIISMHEIWYNEGTPYDIEYEYTYDAKGYVKSESFSGLDGAGTYSYKMNKNGWIVSSSYDGDAEGYLIRGTTTYTYLDIDEHGNWHSATVKEKFTSDGETDVTTRSISRKITYWK